MKNLDPISAHKSPEELKEVREVKKQTLLGQMAVQKGLILWEFDPESKILEEATFASTLTEGFHLNQKHKRMIHKVLERKKGCIYFQALNRKNALKKIERLVK